MSKKEEVITILTGVDTFKINSKSTVLLKKPTIDIFARISRDSVIYLSNCTLYEIYKKKLQGDEKEYLEFFNNHVVEDSVLKFPYNDKLRNEYLIFKLDSNVSKVYKLKNLDSFYSAYIDFCDKKLFVKPTASNNQLFSILYYAFKNNYFSYHNRYNGKWEIVPYDSLSVFKNTKPLFPVL